MDTTPGNNLHTYWTKNKDGLAKWATKPHPYTTLYKHLLKHLKNPDYAHRTAAKWFSDVFGYWPGSDANRVAHGKPPKGHNIGPG